MSTARLLRDQLRQAHQFLNGVIADVTDEQAHWHPPGLANPLGATYAHVLLGEDLFIATLTGGSPQFADGGAARAGVSALPPLGEPGAVPPLNPSWGDWGRGVRVDLPALNSYGQAVQRVSDDYLATLDDADLNQCIDLSSAGFGEQPLAWLLSAGLIGHVLSHWGEIVCLKGLQGSRGFPV